MKKNLYEQPFSEAFSFKLEKDLLSGTGDPWVVIDEVNLPDDEYDDETE